MVQADPRHPIAALVLEHPLGQEVLLDALRRVADLDSLFGQERVGLAVAKPLSAPCCWAK
jgi:hypothetical protein